MLPKRPKDLKDPKDLKNPEDIYLDPKMKNCPKDLKT